MSPNSRLYHILSKVMWHINEFVARTHWSSLRRKLTGRNTGLSEEVIESLKTELGKNYYFILTFNKTALSNWLVGLLNVLLTGRWPQYAHVFMNVDDSANPGQFKLMEANHAGVGWIDFEHAFNCDNVCLLYPANMGPGQWTAILDKLLASEGTPYDDLFDLVDDRKVSCVEVCRRALQASSTYILDFARFEEAIRTKKNLTPQMWRDCPDFDVRLEYRS